MARTSALWTRRSTRETTQAAFGKTSRHSGKGRLVVTVADAIRYRGHGAAGRSGDPSPSSATHPDSLLRRRSGAIICSRSPIECADEDQPLILRQLRATFSFEMIERGPTHSALWRSQHRPVCSILHTFELGTEPFPSRALVSIRPAQTAVRRNAGAGEEPGRSGLERTFGWGRTGGLLWGLRRPCRQAPTTKPPCPDHQLALSASAPSWITPPCCCRAPEQHTR
jgi:hypothetical protein